MRTGLITGHNVDAINVEAGVRECSACGYDDPRTLQVIEYALMRWARGEEEAAQRGAIDASFYGVNFTSWLRILAVAKARAGENDLAAIV
jgi:hypothetical protein